MTVRVRVIPCLDVANGRVVKGVNFVELKDAGDPVEQARAYDAAGADELCFLDITASHEARGTLLDIVTRTAEVCFKRLHECFARFAMNDKGPMNPTGPLAGYRMSGPLNPRLTG